jgi:polar amino acid transport system substrate-binding protein
MKVGYRAWALFLLVTISVSTHVAAQSPMAISLVEDPWPPYIEGQVGENATGGKLIELYRELFSRIDGVEVQYLLLPWKRALLEVERGRQDGIMALFKSPDRASVMDFTAPIFTGRTMLWYAQSKYAEPINWDTIDDLKAYNIVVLRGSAMADPLLDAVDRGIPLSIVEVDSHQQQFELVLKGRADIAPLTEVVGYHLLNQEELKGTMLPMEKPLSDDDVYYMAFSKKSPARKLIPRINAVIDEMQKEGLIARFLLGDSSAELPSN